MEQTRATCPCCGAPLPVTNEILIDRESRGVLIRGRVVRLTRVEMRLFNVLHKNMPHIVQMHLLVGALWRGVKRPQFPRKNVKVYVNRLRNVLRPAGVRIENLRGTGYRMITGAGHGMEPKKDRAADAAVGGGAAPEGHSPKDGGVS